MLFFFICSQRYNLKNEQIQQGALELVTDRLPEMAEHSREVVSSNVMDIISRIKDILRISKEETLLASCMKSLRAIGQTAQDNEEPLLTETLPFVLKVVREGRAVGESLVVLPVLM